MATVETKQSFPFSLSLFKNLCQAQHRMQVGVLTSWPGVFHTWMPKAPFPTIKVTGLGRKWDKNNCPTTFLFSLFLSHKLLDWNMPSIWFYGSIL